ncbi:molybdopterin-guanine dinucleotide biosynthesis protein A [Paenibacillus mucilaginosus 3016]|uniref:Molybdopterin-guanine dinucleotide biosynthesis protein A n=1 Tax=Paenibacillus mucilaginosus 3016 TaxID=1116391 RepID=H6NEW8_9BACL|nr:molybdenum cofactor guanylyltransferase [Paenibacillus mucilaginosus]AFC28659.1 molybdopterin-guanine dinucleotide biosynthesis protein A [Paenibacillus mucilaginosus 3016]WFA17439.1 molybdenum cofactor guanylyltransferase [Paenibacillus mucilaginosus]
MLTGLILAGGESKRMNGANKSMLKFEYETLLQRQVRLMRTVCSELMIVTNDPKSYLRQVDESVRIITDYIPGKGPLSGLHAGLTLARGEQVWAVGCGMPFLSPKAAQLLLEQKNRGFDAAFPRVENMIYPLHGIYDRSCGKRIGELLQSGEGRPDALHRVLNAALVEEEVFTGQGISASFVFEIKTEEDYFTAAEILEGRSAVSG